MIRYTLASISLPIMLLLGCSTTSHERWENIDRRMVELAQITKALEKRVDDLSRSISLIVNDGNFIHNELDTIRDNGKDIEQKIEETSIVTRNLDEKIRNLEIHYKTMEEGFNKEMDDIKKAEIELSNRLELMRLEVKEKNDSSLK